MGNAFDLIQVAAIIDEHAWDPHTRMVTIGNHSERAIRQEVALLKAQRIVELLDNTEGDPSAYSVGSHEQ